MRSLIGGIRATRTPKTPIPHAPTRSGAGVLNPLTGGNTSSGTPQVQHLAAMGSVGTLNAIVGRISESCAGVNWHLYVKAKPGQPPESRKEITSHAALDLWNQPNPFFTRQEFVETTQQHYELTGEEWWVLRRAGSLPLEMWPIRPDRMRPVPSPTEYISGYIYRSPDGDDIPLDVKDVIFIRRPNPVDLYRGLGVVPSILTDLDSARFAAEWNRNFFVNSAEPGGIIQVDKRLSDDEYGEMVMRWREQHQGVAQAHRVAVIEQGQWIDRKYSMRDMQFTELRNLSSEVIREAFAFPKPMLGTVTDVNRCHDEDTEILTADGWKPFPKLADDDLIATVDKATRRLEYHKPIHRFEYDYSGQMVRIQNRMLDVKVTPNHTMVFNTDRMAAWRTCRADELCSRFNVMAAVDPEAAADVPDIPLFTLPAVEYDNGHNRGHAVTVPMDDWLEFLGWAISEGGVLSEEKAGGRYVMTLTQRTYPDRVRACLERLPFASHEYSDADGVSRWNLAGKGLIVWMREHIGTHAQNKRLPRWTLGLSLRQRSIFFDALMAGDGSWDPRPGRQSGYYSTTSPELADDVMELAFTLGYRTSIYSADPTQPRHSRLYIVRLSERHQSKVSAKTDITTEEYTGKVYSCEVPNHVYVTRRNGRIAIHGNSNAEAAEVVFARWLIKARLERKKIALNADLLPQYGRTATNLEFDYENPVPDDAELAVKELTAKTQAYVLLTSTGGVTPESAAEVCGLPAMEHKEPEPVPPALAEAAGLPPAQDAGPPAEDGKTPGEDGGKPDDGLTDAMRRAVAAEVRAMATHQHAHITDAVPPPPAPEPPTDGTPATLPPGAAPDLQPVQDEWETTLATLVVLWLLAAGGDDDARAKTKTGLAGIGGALVAQVRAAVESRDLLALNRLIVDPVTLAKVGDEIGEHLIELGQSAARQVVTEAAAQGVTVGTGIVDRAALKATGHLAAGTLADGLKLTASREAARVWGPGVDADTVAEHVAEAVKDLTPAQPEYVLGGAATAAQAAGREATVLAGPSAALYSAADLDRNTCEPCRDLDGKWVGNSDDPSRPWRALFPVRGYIGCLGRDRCRCQIVSVWRGGKDWTQWVEKEPVKEGNI